MIVFPYFFLYLQSVDPLCPCAGLRPDSPGPSLLRHRAAHMAQRKAAAIPATFRRDLGMEKTGHADHHKLMKDGRKPAGRSAGRYRKDRVPPLPEAAALAGTRCSARQCRILSHGPFGWHPRRPAARVIRPRRSGGSGRCGDVLCCRRLQHDEDRPAVALAALPWGQARAGSPRRYPCHTGRGPLVLRGPDGGAGGGGCEARFGIAVPVRPANAHGPMVHSSRAIESGHRKRATG